MHVCVCVCVCVCVRVCVIIMSLIPPTDLQQYRQMGWFLAAPLLSPV